MIELLIVLIGYIIAFEVEVRHDAILSGLGQSKTEGKLWHKYDTYFHFIIAFLIAYLYNGVSLEGGFILLYIFALRITYFPIRLNMIREKPFFYLSKNGWDGHFEGNRKLYFIVAFALLFGSLFILIRTQL